ncbi:transcription factor Vhr1-domain-containing protein [Lipomyces starkeyi]
MGIAPRMTQGRGFPDKVSIFAGLGSHKLHHEPSTSTTAYLATFSPPSFSNSVFIPISVSTSSVKWILEDACLNLSRLQNYIRSAFFIEAQTQFSILYKHAMFSSKTQYHYVHDDSCLIRQALGNVDLVVEKLQFTDEGLWKKFSARRLELIDSMSLSTKKSSEQYDVIIAVADTLRDEYGFPHSSRLLTSWFARLYSQFDETGSDFQSPRLGKSLSVERDGQNGEEEQQHQSQNILFTGQWPSSSGS